MTELGKKNLYPGMRQQIIGTAEDITEHRQANEKRRPRPASISRTRPEESTVQGFDIQIPHSLVLNTMLLWLMYAA